MAKAEKKSKKQQHKGEKEKIEGSILINFVLDKSGSMMTCVRDTIGGFNAYIKKLKEDKDNTYKMSLTLFDTSFEKRFIGTDLKDIPELNPSTYLPSGMTALHDAIGHSVAAIEAQGDRIGKVLTVILTDGEENSSREYRLEQIKSLIQRKEAQGNWTFVFLGASLDAFAAGDRMGIATANSVAYNPQNVAAVYANTASATMCFAGERGTTATKDLYSRVPMRKMAAAGMRRRTS